MLPPEIVAAFAVLGVTPEATESDLKAAYRVRASLVHPDVHQHRGEDVLTHASEAMRQLTDAYRLAVRHARDQSPAARSSSRQARRADAPPESRSDERAEADDREFCYRTSEWTRADRERLGQVLEQLAVPFYWESEDLVIDDEHELVVDHLIAAFDDLITTLSTVRDDDVEILFDLASSPSSFRWAVPTALTAMDVPWFLEGTELVVDKRFEFCTEELLTAAELR
ncbi:MAG: J domain-containing protein [Actinomycetota bacterium]|nr:J domain-containing protein [Actinomycetota bacterium]